MVEEDSIQLEKPILYLENKFEDYQIARLLRGLPKSYLFDYEGEGIDFSEILVFSEKISQESLILKKTGEKQIKKVTANYNPQFKNPSRISCSLSFSRENFAELCEFYTKIIIESQRVKFPYDYLLLSQKHRDNFSDAIRLLKENGQIPLEIILELTPQYYRLKQ